MAGTDGTGRVPAKRNFPGGTQSPQPRSVKIGLIGVKQGVANGLWKTSLLKRAVIHSMKTIRKAQVESHKETIGKI